MMALNGVLDALRRHPEARAIAFGAGGRVELTFSQLARRVAAAAARLSRRGVGRGSRVGILAPNSLDWIAADLACLALGAISVPFDPGHAWNTDEWELAALVTADDRFDEQADDALVAHVFAPEDAYTVKFSSGTSARPKAVDARVLHFDQMARETAAMFPLGADDLFLVIAPLSTWLQRFMVELSILQGASFCLVSPERTILALEAERPSIVLGVPRLLQTVHAVQQRRGTRLADAWGGRMRYLWTGSAPIDRALLRAYEEGGVPVYEGYGTTETGMIAKNHPGARRVGSVGRPFPGREVRIGDDGEILVRSVFHANAAYWRGDGDCFRDDGWVATGDAGHFDEDGFLYVDDRLRDTLVLCSGHKVLPSAIEEALRVQPLIGDCAVFGHARDHLVAVIASPDAAADDDALHAALASAGHALPPHERVLGFVRVRDFASEGLLTPGGKVNRRVILERFGARIDALYRHG